MSERGDADVERAVAAFSAPSMPYRTFRAEPGAAVVAEPSRGSRVEFPLLAAALPEMEHVAVPARPPAGVAVAVEEQAPVSCKADDFPPCPPAAPQALEPSVPSITDRGRAWPGNAMSAPLSDPVPTRMSLAAMFRLLRGERAGSVRSPAPPSGRLQELFRRL